LTFEVQISAVQNVPFCWRRQELQILSITAFHQIRAKFNSIEFLQQIASKDRPQIPNMEAARSFNHDFFRRTYGSAFCGVGNALTSPEGV
jgi:hypothetical protein